MPSSRKQQLVQTGSYSDYSNIESDVPQGPFLGPLLFLVYINDLERNIKCNVKFFADDTMLFSILKNPEISANDLNSGLDVIHHLVRNLIQTIHRLCLMGTVAAKMNEQKHLGLTLDSRLSFEKHLNEGYEESRNN